MRFHHHLLLLALILSPEANCYQTPVLPAAPPPASLDTARAQLAKAYDDLPLRFEANHGQLAKDVRFRAIGTGSAFSLTDDTAVLSVANNTVRLKPVGASPSIRVTGLEELQGKSNYLTGNDRAKWHTNIPTYARVRYENVYPGIDLVYYGRNGSLEFDFIVQSGADPNRIRLELTSEDGKPISPRRNDLGDLVIPTSSGDIQVHKPAVYQVTGGSRKPVDGRYELQGNQIKFAVAGYDRSKALVIDPVITYATYLGASHSLRDFATGVAVYTDPISGHTYAYVSGFTGGDNFPTVNPLQSTMMGPQDAFVVKFDPSLTGAASVVYATYFGGTGVDQANAIAVDAQGNVYISGWTTSLDLPIFNAFQSTIGGQGTNQCNNSDPTFSSSDAFLVKLNPSGSSLLYSTYLGGSGCDSARALAVDSTGKAYLAGTTDSINLPVLNAFQASRPGSEPSPFVAVLDTTLIGTSSLRYGTYLGGSSHFYNDGFRPEGANSIAVDPQGFIHLGGVTTASDFPIVHGFQTDRGTGAGAGFYARLNPSAIGAAQLVYSTFIGTGAPFASDQRESVTGVATDAAGKAYLTGFAFTPAFPVTPGAFSTTPWISDYSPNVFAMKIDPALVGAASLIYSTRLGAANSGGPDAGGSSITVDNSGNAIIAGSTTGPFFPLVDASRRFSSGLLQSGDSGWSWNGVGKGIDQFPVLAIAIDTSTSPRTLYAATGAGPGGLFRSTDGGLNWSLSNTGLNRNVEAIAIDASNPLILYAGTDDGVYRSIDGGGNWAAFNMGITFSGVYHDVHALLFDGSTLYAGTAEGGFKLGGGTSTWVNIGPTIPIESLAVDTGTSPHTLYASSDPAGAYRSSDGGLSWVLINNLSDDLLHSVAVDRSVTPQRLYAIDADYGRVLRSADRGATWEPISLTGGVPGQILFDTSTSPSTIYVRTNAGLRASKDDGASSFDVLRSAYSAAIDNSVAGSSSLYVGLQGLYDEGFVAKLNPSGTSLIYSTIIGGVLGTTYSTGIARDSSGNVYVSGRTDSWSFPTVNAFRPNYSGDRGDTVGSFNIPPDNNGFFVKLGSAELAVNPSGPVGTAVAVEGGTLSIAFPNVTGSTTSQAPTISVTPVTTEAAATFSLSNNLGAFEITTTAVFHASTSQPAVVCFQALTVNDPTTFAGLKLFHIVNAVPVDVTYQRDFPNRTICGTVTSFSPFILVKGALDQLKDLIRDVNINDVRHGIQNSLDSKLSNALNSLTSAKKNDLNGACSSINSFLNEVLAQTGKSLTSQEAASLTGSGKQVRIVMACPK